MNTDTSYIVATAVPHHLRLRFLPHHFGRSMMRVESEIFTQMGDLCADYAGAFWEFYNLSNGGCYMAPQSAERVAISVDGNGYQGTVSADAAGIIATLFALSHLSMRYPTDWRMSERFHQLREYAQQHGEAAHIFAAID